MIRFRTGRFPESLFEPDWRPSSYAVMPPPMTWARWGSHDPGRGVHGFVDDSRLSGMLRGRFAGEGSGRVWAVEPDFSVVGGMPAPLVWYQVYRARWGGELLRRRGLSVLPVLQWAGPEHLDLCAWGLISGTAVAVRAPGRDFAERNAWIGGFSRLVELVQPSGILVFGLHSRVRGVLDASGVPWSSVSLCSKNRTRRDP